MSTQYFGDNDLTLLSINFGLSDHRSRQLLRGRGQMATTNFGLFSHRICWRSSPEVLLRAFSKSCTFCRIVNWSTSLTIRCISLCSRDNWICKWKAPGCFSNPPCRVQIYARICALHKKSLVLFPRFRSLSKVCRFHAISFVDLHFFGGW